MISSSLGIKEPLFSELSYQVPLKMPGGLYAGPALIEADYNTLKTTWQIEVIVNLREAVEEWINDPTPWWYWTFEVIRFPIKDQRAPNSLEEARKLIERIQSLVGTHHVYIHCQAGKGRTGTIVACYLISQDGISATEAIQKVRELSPGSIHTETQKEFIQEYELYLKTFIIPPQI